MARWLAIQVPQALASLVPVEARITHTLHFRRYPRRPGIRRQAEFHQLPPDRFQRLIKSSVRHGWPQRAKASTLACSSFSVSGSGEVRVGCRSSASTSASCSVARLLCSSRLIAVSLVRLVAMLCAQTPIPCGTTQPDHIAAGRQHAPAHRARIQHHTLSRHLARRWDRHPPPAVPPGAFSPSPGSTGTLAIRFAMNGCLPDKRADPAPPRAGAQAHRAPIDSPAPNLPRAWNVLLQCPCREHAAAEPKHGPEQEQQPDSLHALIMRGRAPSRRPAPLMQRGSTQRKQYFPQDCTVEDTVTSIASQLPDRYESHPTWKTMPPALR